MTFNEFITALEKGLGTTIETEGDAGLAYALGGRSRELWRSGGAMCAFLFGKRTVT